MLILDEQKRALHLLEFGFTGILGYQDICILARYFRYLEYTPKKIKNSIVDFYKKFDPTYNEVIFGNRIDRAIKKSKKYPLKICQDVYITKNELEKIKEIKNFRYEKILFVMLVLSRYDRLSKNEDYKEYRLYLDFSNVLKLSKVYANKIEKESIRKELQDFGMIEYKKPKDESDFYSDVFILHYFDDNSDKEVWVTDINNILSFYPFYCNVCGNKIDRKSNHQEMCSDCWNEKRKISQKNIMRIKRGNVSV
jgi:hypothetical protein